MLRLTLRNLFARKVRLLMSGLSVILGVAFLSGVLVFSNGLGSTFDNIINGSTPDGVVRLQGAGDADPFVTSQTNQYLTPALIEKIRELPEVAHADGDVIGLGMNLLGKDGTVVGGTGAPTLAFNNSTTPNMAGEEILHLIDGAWPTEPGQVVLDEKAADAGGYRIGDPVGLLSPFGELEQSAILVGTAEFNGGGTAGATLLIFSTQGAQDLFLGGNDVFNQISLTGAPGVSQARLVAAVQTVLPAGYEAVTGDQVVGEQQDSFGVFLNVIDTFLLVFAVIAVIVGAFIIVNTFSILVAQRTRELALLRALGAARAQITRSVLVEALVLAVLASTLGIAIGLALARGLAAVFREVGLDIASDALKLTGGTAIAAYVVGIGVTMLAAYLPARRGGKVPPVAAMRADLVADPRSLRRRALLGAVVLVLGAGLAVAGLMDAPGSDAAWIGVGAVLWILTIAAISSVVGKPVLLACRALFGRLFGASGQLAGENALRDPRRTGATASALMIGLALVSTIGVLATSLNKSVDDLVDEQFTADLLVQNTNFQPFSTEIGDRIEAVPGVQTLSRQQFVSARYDGDDSVYVSGVDSTFDTIYHLDVDAGRQNMAGPEAVIFKEFGVQHGLQVGDGLTLGFQGGKQLAVTVVGIVEAQDITSEVTVPLEELASAGLLRQDTALSILIDPESDASTVREAVDEAASAAPVVAVYDKEEFADSLGDQINQLLVMIYGLLALAIIIAVIGIINTLGLSVIERTREIGLLRAIGMSRAGLRRMITLESVAISVLGAVLGMALGLVIGTLLQRALSDDLTSLGLPLGQLALFLLISVVVGVLAAVIPAVRASRLQVLEAIATE